MPADPDNLVSLTTALNYFEAETIAAVLRAEGIPVFVEANVGTTLGIAGAAIGDAIHVRVRRRDVERARAALDRNREDSVDLDWSEVDVGEPADPWAGRLPRLRMSRWGRAAKWMLGFALLIGGMAALLARTHQPPVTVIGTTAIVLAIVLMLSAAHRRTARDSR